MAIKYYSSIDLNKNELQNAVIQPLGSAPGSPSEGQIYYDNTGGDKALHFYNGSAWVRLAGQVAAQTTDTIASGDFISFSDESETGDINNKLTVDNFITTSPKLLTEAAVANGDYIMFLDGGATGDAKKEAVHDLATLFAGSGLTATNSVITVDGDIDTTGEAGTVATIGNLTGDVTSSNRATTIASAAVHHAMLNDDIISGQGAVTALAQDDLLVVHDTSAGTVNKITYSDLEDDIFGNISGDGTVAAGGALTVTQSAGNFTVTGNLIVSGTTTTVNTATLTVEDPLIKLASGNSSADSVDIGFYGLYDNSGSQDVYTGLTRDASDDKWHLWKLNQAEPTTVVNHSGTGFAVDTLVANLEGNVTGTATVATSVTASSNTADETVYLTFVDGQTGTQGIETAQYLTYNPDTRMLTSQGLTGTLTGDVTGDLTGNADTADLATAVTVTDSTANTDFPVVFHNESNALLDDTAAFEYNPSSGTLIVANLDIGTDVDVDGTLETDALTIAGTAIVAQATASAVGGVELATAAEVITGTDAARVVTADTLSAKSVVCDIDVSSLTDALIVTITHNLGTADIVVQVYDKTTEANIMCDIARTTDDFSTASTSVVSIDFGTAPPNDCRALITSLAGATAGSIAYT